ncbi:MAG: DUF2935 domain-containing protein [Lachnospiraceae bacterium]
MENYVSMSIETHLFFARIMKEHAIFLEAGFPCINKEWIKKADWYKEQFESLLKSAVKIANGRINHHIIKSNEIVTEYTIPAEEYTEKLSGISIDSSISQMEKNLRSGCDINKMRGREIYMTVFQLNRLSVKLLSGLISFKESILEEVGKNNLFTTNYPLLIQHIIREAKLYKDTIEQIMRNNNMSYKNILETENFWNRIMMEHALFIRGLLDPSECELIDTADEFAHEYCELLELAKSKECSITEEFKHNLREKSLDETIKYSKFKAAGTKGILNSEISSIILPLLADHVLREANHYIRILDSQHK